MRALTEAEIKEVANLFILANTPGFLLESMVRSQFVQSLAKEATEEELFEIYHTYSCSDPTETNAAVAYAALVALLIKRREDCKGFDVPIELDRLHWGKKIIKIMDRRTLCTTRQDLVSSLPRPNIFTERQIIMIPTETEYQSIVKQLSPEVTNIDSSAGPNRVIITST